MTEERTVNCDYDKHNISVVICDLDIPYLVNPVTVATYAYVFITIDSSLNH